LIPVQAVAGELTQGEFSWNATRVSSAAGGLVDGIGHRVLGIAGRLRGIALQYVNRNSDQWFRFESAIMAQRVERSETLH
jgi:hypothetical protein